MESSALLLDLAIGSAAGYAATKVTQAIQPVLYRLTPREIHKREESVRPGQPSRIAAKKIAQQMGIAMRGKWLARAASAVHRGTGLGVGADVWIAAALQRYAPLVSRARDRRGNVADRG